MTDDLLICACEQRHPVIVLSPHLDDALLSCAAFISYAARRTSVTVVTFFTEAAARPWTISARQFLRQVGAIDALDLYRRRRGEDRSVLDMLGVRCVHVGLPDALFRRRADRWATLARGPAPELGYVYPTYRWHVARGVVSRHDRATVAVVRRVVADLAADRPRVLLAPAAVGNHVDHVIVRDAALACRPTDRSRIIYYRDFPYDRDPSARLPLHVHGAAMEWTVGIERRPELIGAYRTQARALFPAGIPASAEHYFVPVSNGGRTP